MSHTYLHWRAVSKEAICNEVNKTPVSEMVTMIKIGTPWDGQLHPNFQLLFSDVSVIDRRG